VQLAEAAAAAPAARPSALVLAGRIRHSEGDLAGARAAFDQVLAGPPERLDAATAALARHCLGLLLEHGDHFAEAAGLLDRAADDARRAGAFRTLTTSLFAAALAYGNLGDLATALARAEAMAPLVAEIDDPLYHARLATTRSWLWRELGQLGRAGDLAAEAVELTADAPRSHPAMHARLGRAECALLAGDDAQAASLLDRAGSDQGPGGRSFAYGWRVELRQLELRARLEPGLAEELLALASGRGSAKYQALALARLGRPAEAAAVAASTGSDHLLALVGPPEVARAAAGRLAGRLPPGLREGFLAGGRAAAPLGG
jgi:tetratricopeptide (TPR) repeat protein